MSWKSRALNAHIDPVFIEPVLESVDRWRRYNVFRKTVPFSNHFLAKGVFPDV